MKRIAYTITPYTTVIRLLGVVQNPANGFPARPLGVAQLRFLASLVGNKPNGLFFAGDLGQRIFQQPFSWRDLGVEVRGRSRTLRINYRTSHQIRSQADLLLDPRMADVDGNVEERKGTVVKGGGKTYHWGGVKLYHRGDA